MVFRGRGRNGGDIQMYPCVRCGSLLTHYKMWFLVFRRLATLALLEQEHYRMRVKELRGFPSYLFNTKKWGKVHGLLSDLESARMKATQGYCLGPLLYKIYVDDFYLSQRYIGYMYVDDILLSFSSNSIHLITEFDFKSRWE